PNPATSQVTLNVTLNEYTAVNIRVYNSMGTLVLSRSVSGYPGVNQITLPIANLPTGVYYIQLQFGSTILKSKIQKL
ncbi:MAG TPA: T9SS type A sorting domain-containing protein, partial [Puia sp.]|nr:T9SS type A sorting domain-containing protein [Puia sp.]